MKWTANAGATEFGIDRHSLVKWLSMSGVPTGNGRRYTTLEIHKAIAGDLEYERTRLTRADADLREMERQQLRGELVKLSDVAALVNPILLACRQRLNALASEMGSKCNPSDPTHAEAQLSDWTARSLPQVREKLPMPEEKKKEKE